MFPTAIATWTTDLEFFSGYQRLDNKLLPENKIASYIGEEYMFHYRNQISGVTSNGSVWAFSLPTRGLAMLPISHLINLSLSLKENEATRSQITTSVEIE